MKTMMIESHVVSVFYKSLKGFDDARPLFVFAESQIPPIRRGEKVIHEGVAYVIWEVRHSFLDGFHRVSILVCEDIPNNQRSYDEDHTLRQHEVP
jgi:hypothetical protein